MIHDLTNLEPLLHRYDHEKVLVGPLLNLWMNSSFRVFNIAGKGSKIHETIGLGFFEVETDAQRLRADIVAALEGCFGEVESFDGQLEMAQMAHTLWANDETARFLATVSWQSKPQPARETGQNRNLADPDKVTMLSDDRNNESGDEEACTAVAAPEAIALGPTHAPQPAGDQAQPTRGLTQIAEPLYLHNLSDTDTFAAFADSGTLAKSGSNLQAVRNLLPAVAGNFFSKKYRLWALSGAAAYLAACFVVGFLIGTIIFNSLTSKRQTANEATLSSKAAASITAGNEPSQATQTVTQPIPASSIGTASEAQPREAVRATAPPLPTSQPRMAEGQADAAPSPTAQASQNPGDQTGAVADERLSQVPKAQDNQADNSISPPQSSPPQTIQSSAAETVPVSIPQPPEAAPVQVLVSPASAQITADRDGPELLPSEATAPKAPEALSAASQRQASNSAIVPLPRPRPAASAVSSDHPRRRVGAAGEGTRNPLLSLFGH
jgi:hypothetical protein